LGLPGFEHGYAEGSVFWIVNNIYFQYYSLFITAVSTLVLYAVSYATEPPPPEKIHELTYSTITTDQRRETRASWNHWDVINSGIVLGLILLAYLYFTG
jgi:SSS family solute:Na+ symporter